MATVNLPYGKGFINADIPDDRLRGILQSGAHHFKATGVQEELVRNALSNPIQSERLRELAREKKKIVLIASDHTRPVPSKIITPIILEEIRAGNPQAEITILIATGFHRASTQEELIEKFGVEIVAEENIVMHDSRDVTSMVNIGKLPSGGDIVLNKLAVEADLLIAEGFVEPHFFAGFSGGRKSVLPGIASKVTVLANHSSKFIADVNARAGVLKNNPLNIDMLYAAKQAGLRFIVNVVIDADKKIIKAFAGDPEVAHEQGCEFVGKLAAVDALPADIVITTNGGYPLDQNIYQIVKGMSAAESSCVLNGVIIICAACNDGHGGKEFYRWFSRGRSPQEVSEEIMRIDAQNTRPDQWQAQVLARILKKHKVIVVTDQCDHKLIKEMSMLAAKSLPEAMQMAENIVGSDASITVIPDGVSVIVR